MMQNPETLDVQEGYWKGLNTTNLNAAFRPSVARTAAVSLLADYSALFGPNFLRCRQDIRPFLPPKYAQRLTLTGPPSPIEEGTPPSVPSEAQLVEALRKPLETMKRAEGLQEWLLTKLAHEGDDDEVLQAWCDHWASRIGSAEHYQQQLLLSSLFMQSLRRLEGLSGRVFTDVVTTEAYMLLDIADGELTPQCRCLKEGSPPDEPDLVEALKDLALSPVYTSYASARERLVSLIGTAQPADKVFKQIHTHDIRFHHRLLQHSSLHHHWKDVIVLDRLRLLDVIQCFDDSKSRRVVKVAAEGVSISAASGRPDYLLEDQSVKDLKLTNWQLRLLMVPDAEPSRILTREQLALFRHEALDDMYLLDLSRVLPIRLKRTPLRIPVEEQLRDKHDLLDKLFGDLSQTPGEPHSGRSPGFLPPSPSKSPPLSPPAITVLDAGRCVREEFEAASMSWKESLTGEITKIVHEVGEVMSCLVGLRKEVKEEVEATRTALKKECKAVRESLSQVPGPGDKGFLTKQCPAPEGRDQATYESILLRAAWFYVTLIGSPEGGVPADEDAIKETAERFPGPPLEHLVTALEHIHMQAYHRPFNPE